MNRYASLNSAALDGRFVTFAIKDECTNAKAKQSEHEISKRSKRRERLRP